MPVGWDVKWCPVSKITTPLAHKKTVSLDFEEEKAREGAQRNFKISKPIINLIITAATWLEYCRYGVKPKTITGA